MNKVNIYVVRKVSRKEGKEEFSYVQMYADLGYRKAVLSMDAQLIAETIQTAVACLYDLKENEPNKVAELDITKGE